MTASEIVTEPANHPGRRRRVRNGLLCLVAGAVTLIGTPTHASNIILTDVTDRTGITFKHADGATGGYYIMETVTAGLALFDYDRDGDIDIYFVNGAPIGRPGTKDSPTNALYRNAGNWKFTDVTQQAGVGDTGFGLGVAVADYDNDGDPDIYVNNHGPNVLYRNNGDGTFTDVTEQAGVANGSAMGAGANFLDMDGDGDLDLYVSNYVTFDPAKHVYAVRGGYPIYRGPGLGVYKPTPDTLFRNNGDGTFADVTEQSGLAGTLGSGMGTVCGDFDNDGDTDIAVANDMTPNFLFVNDGTGRFEETGLLAGIAYDQHGDEQGNMGIDAGDYDNDGWLDLYVTSYQEQWAVLFRNLGEGEFEDVTLTAGVAVGTYANVTWGTSFQDFDNDGDRDLFVACGHLQTNIEKFDDRLTFNAKNVLFMNTGDGKFVDVTDKSGTGMQVRLSSRGAGFDDMDNDGDIDVVILNSRQRPTLLRNDTPSPGHWLGVRLRGTKTNRDGVGARVTVTARDLTLVDEVHSGRGYQSHYGSRLHFGLGNRDKVDSVRVRWVGGSVDVFTDIRVDQLLTLVEGSSQAGGKPG